METLADRFKYVADALGGTHVLAWAMGVSPKSAYAYLAGRPCPRRRILRIAQMLDVDAAWVEHGIGTPPKESTLAELGRTFLATRPPTGLRRLSAERSQLDGLVEQVKGALARAEEDSTLAAALASALPESLLTAYRLGTAIPGPAHWRLLVEIIPGLDSPEGGK